MRVAYFQCASGVSGDMVLGALVAAGAHLERMQEAVDALGPGMPRLAAHDVQRAGFAATKVDVVLTKPTAEHDAPAGHRSLSQMISVVEDSRLPDSQKRDSLAVFRRLGEAEARVHGIDPAQLALAELGSDDTLADIVGAVAGLADLGIQQIYSSALALGSGRVRTHHGVLTVPAPGVLELVRLSNAPITLPPPGTEPVGELVTPTGAALMTTLATFAAPSMTVALVGYGAGTRDPAGTPNVLTVWVGEAVTVQPRMEMVMIETTVDDMNPEIYGYVREALMSEGARDVWLVPVQMKKGRPGIVITAIASPQNERRLVDVLLYETSTLGVRVTPIHRYEAERSIHVIETVYGPIQVKAKTLAGRIASVAPEYEDCRKVAVRTGVPLQTVMAAARRTGEEQLMGIGGLGPSQVRPSLSREGKGEPDDGRGS